MQHDHFQKRKKKTFDPTPGVGGVCDDRTSFIMRLFIISVINIYGKCSKISNTLKLRTPKIIAENNF